MSTQINGTITLLSARTTDGSSSAVAFGGSGTIQIDGNFNGCTITIYGSCDGITWTAITAKTAAYIGLIEQGTILIKAIVSSAGASTSVSVFISPLRN